MAQTLDGTLTTLILIQVESQLGGRRRPSRTAAISGTEICTNFPRSFADGDKRALFNSRPVT